MAVDWQSVDGHDPRLQRLCDLLKIDSERDKLRSLLRIGVQSECEVHTLRGFII